VWDTPAHSLLRLLRQMNCTLRWMIIWLIQRQMPHFQLQRMVIQWERGMFRKLQILPVFLIPTDRYRLMGPRVVTYKVLLMKILRHGILAMQSPLLGCSLVHNSIKMLAHGILQTYKTCRECSCLLLVCDNRLWQISLKILTFNLTNDFNYKL
jgi:hypothetical protein